MRGECCKLGTCFASLRKDSLLHLYLTGPIFAFATLTAVRGKKTKRSLQERGVLYLAGPIFALSHLTVDGRKKPKVPFHRLVTQTRFSLCSNLVCSTRNQTWNSTLYFIFSIAKKILKLNKMGKESYFFETYVTCVPICNSLIFLLLLSSTWTQKSNRKLPV